jgi:hypothetical protein
MRRPGWSSGIKISGKANALHDAAGNEDSGELGGEKMAGKGVGRV